jgi:hypothetical protein
MNMSDIETIVSYPKGMKATVYFTGTNGLTKKESVFLSFSVWKKYAQHEGVPSVRFRDPGKKLGWSFDRGERRDRFILVIEGWGHPEVPVFPWQTMLPVWDRLNYQPYLARFRDALLARSRKTGRKLIVDVHEATSAPHFMTEPERQRTRRVIEELWSRYRASEMSPEDLKAETAKQVFTLEGEAELMLNDPVFEDEFREEFARMERVKS